MPEDFKVRVGEFEGPLELLLDLVEKRKLHISEVSLSEVADEFIEYTKSFEDFPIADSADFILVASTLLLIKSKSLLPNMELTEEEKISIEELEHRLESYKRYKKMAAELGQMLGHPFYFAEEKRQTEIVFAPPEELSLLSLKKSLEEILKNTPQKEAPLPKVAVQKIINLEEMIEKLSERIKKGLQTSFNDFSKMADGSTSSPQAKLDVIVSFLAMLELVKRGLVRVEQQKHFEDISIQSEEINTPTYQ